MFPVHLMRVSISASSLSGSTSSLPLGGAAGAPLVCGCAGRGPVDGLGLAWAPRRHRALQQAVPAGLHPQQLPAGALTQSDQDSGASENSFQFGVNCIFMKKWR